MTHVHIGNYEVVSGQETPCVTSEVSKSVCEIPVELDKVGMTLMGGLNPVAPAIESGTAVENHSMSTVMNYRELTRFRDL
ncbi:MAG: DUF128 domain-containing protein [Dehalococcoidia bacterium]|nr:MAG: DUF128 domain-containing protein [Dehalococcoidia bacterium]